MDMLRIFIQGGHRRPLPIREKNDGGHIIKRALYIGIKRLCIAILYARYSEYVR